MLSNSDAVEVYYQACIQAQFAAAPCFQHRQTNTPLTTGKRRIKRESAHLNGQSHRFVSFVWFRIGEIGRIACSCLVESWVYREECTNNEEAKDHTTHGEQVVRRKMNRWICPLLLYDPLGHWNVQKIRFTKVSDSDWIRSQKRADMVNVMKWSLNF